MTRDDQLAYCRVCIYRQMDFQQGLLCGKTGSPATFQFTCQDFLRDPDATRQEEKRKKALKNHNGKQLVSDPLHAKTGAILAIVFGLVMLLIGFVTDAFLLFGMTGIISIVVGLGRYKAGHQKERFLKGDDKALDNNDY